jgi:Tfp pilus assembly protein PilF
MRFANSNLFFATLMLLLLLTACQSVSGKKETAKADVPAEVPAAAQAAFDNALTAQRAQQWPEAERQLKQLAEKYPQLSGPHLNLALLYAQTQRPQLAEESFKRALQINPNNIGAYNQYGIWLRTQARFADAEAQYRQALTKNPNSAETHLDLAILYDLYLGKLPQALEHYLRYLELAGDEKSPVHSWVADLQRRMKAG